MSRWSNSKKGWNAGRWAGVRWDAPPAEGTWQSFFDNTRWADDGFGSWNGSEWISSGEPPAIDLIDIGVWYIGFRPTSLRVTYTGPVSINLELYNDVDFQAGPVSVTSLQEVPVTFGASGDFFYMYMETEDLSGITVTNIEFFA